MESMLVICQILKKPICHTCKHSDAFKLISGTSAARKFKVDKKDIDMLNLPFIDAPNPYYHALKMRLYYEFMIKENLGKVNAWRNFKKSKNKEKADEHRDAVKKMKRSAKESKALLALEVEFGRQGRDIPRKVLETKYIENPYMQKFLKGSLKSKCLADIIDEIDSGAAIKNLD
jgi:hypothetical protein